MRLLSRSSGSASGLRCRCLIVGALAAAPLAAASRAGAPADCTVSVVEVTDATRTRAVPYASPSERGATPVKVRGLIYSPGSSGLPAPSFAELVSAETDAGTPLETATSALAYFGLTPPAAEIENALRGGSSCRLAVARPSAPRAAVVVLSAMPAIFYEELATRLATAGVVTLIARASEAEARLLLQHLVSTEGWPADRLALVGHGAASYSTALLAMSSAGVRARVALDGFEALDRSQHPGPTAGREWKPGHERAPVLLVRPRERPHGDLEHFDRAARVALTRLEIAGLEASPWAPSPALAAPPAVLQGLTPGIGAETADVLIDAVKTFLVDRLGDGEAVLLALPPDPKVELSVHHRPALAAPAVVADGRLDEAIWSSARELPPDGPLTVRVAEDCDWIYMAVRAARSLPFTSELYLDLDGEGGDRRGDDDLLLHASASLCRSTGARELASTDCNASDAWWVANRTVRAGDSQVAEYAIAKAHLGVARCAVVERLRFAALASGFGERQLYPQAADPAKPSTWSPLPGSAVRADRDGASHASARVGYREVGSGLRWSNPPRIP